MGSKTKTHLKDAKKLSKEARFTFGHTETRAERLLQEVRFYLEDIRDDDHHMTALAKFHVRRYFEDKGVTDPATLTYDELDDFYREALKPVYTWYLMAADWPCNARYPATDYIPS